MIEAAIRVGELFQIVFVRAERDFGYSSKRYMLSALRIGNWDLSYLLQLYRPGAMIPNHTDGPAWTRTIAIILWQPKVGWLNCGGPCKRYLGGRIVIFNGADPHNVSPECSGYRVSLLLQLARLK